MSPTRPRRNAATAPPVAQPESTMTVLIALGANLLIAIAKTFAAVVTGAASMLAEAAHSWADTGNEIFLWVAGRRAARPADARHPVGFGREA
jgi:divalent metal cation (Fe/Co/Zn/Cd) transporter